MAVFAVRFQRTVVTYLPSGGTGFNQVMVMRGGEIHHEPIRLVFVNNDHYNELQKIETEVQGNNPREGEAEEEIDCTDAGEMQVPHQNETRGEPNCGETARKGQAGKKERNSRKAGRASQ